jgi:hypothetical protein
MSGGGGAGDSQTTIRYAPYVEIHHSDFLDTVASKRAELIGGAAILSFAEWCIKFKGIPYALLQTMWLPSYDAEYAAYVASQAAIGGVPSPFSYYKNIEVEAAFFGVGYLISSFPSLYDMFGKFMAGLDIDILWTQLFEDTVNSPQVGVLVSAEAALLDDDIEINSIPRLQTGMRDINAVMGSSYIIGRAIIEDARVKSISKFSADLKYRLIPVASSRWSTHLDWNKGVVGVYAELMKFYYSAKVDVDEANYAMAAKNSLWPFTVLDFERAALGALQGAMNTKTDVAGASTASKVIGGALSGAAMELWLVVLLIPQLIRLQEQLLLLLVLIGELELEQFLE